MSQIPVDEGSPGIVALIITHKVRAGEEQRYEAWLMDILAASSAFPGYLGRQIFRPSHGGSKYTSVVRFDTPENLNNWRESDTRAEFIDRVTDLLDEGDQVEIRSGIDFWFTPEGTKPPKPWKQFLLTVSAVYPLSLMIGAFVLAPLVRLSPIFANRWLSSLLMAFLLTGMLTFVVMPRYARLMKRWLYAGQE